MEELAVCESTAMADALSLLGSIDPLLRSYVFVSLKDAEIQITRMDRLSQLGMGLEM